MAKAGVLSLGTRRDATTWQKGCESLGFDVAAPVKKPNPSLAELKSFFSSTPEWIFFGGHFGGLTLENERDTVSVVFKKDHVLVKAGGSTQKLTKSSNAFRLHEKCKVVLWGGCNVCQSKFTIETMRHLFGAHTLIGFNGLTGWKMVDAMLGGGFIKDGHHFFSRLKPGELDARAVRNAWLRTARYGYAKGRFESRFRVIAPNGREWLLRNGKIERGRKVS